jgi:hypothetical protein
MIDIFAFLPYPISPVGGHSRTAFRKGKDPPLPFYFLKTPPFFSNTRKARLGIGPPSSDPICALDR